MPSSSERPGNRVLASASAARNASGNAHPTATAATRRLRSKASISDGVRMAAPRCDASVQIPRKARVSPAKFKSALTSFSSLLGFPPMGHGIRGGRMRTVAGALGIAGFLAVMLSGAVQAPEGMTTAPVPLPATKPPPPAAPAPVVPPAAFGSSIVVIRYDHWTEADERGFGEFVTGIGESNCHTVDACLHGSRNPFRASDPQGIYFKSDCADFPYVLRAYYAWKRGLPFSYEYDVEPRGHTRDMRYTAAGNEVAERKDVLSGALSGYELLEELRDTISSAAYRIHPDLDAPLPPDLYSPATNAKSIRPGTLVYDPNGHVATLYRVDPDGRINYIDAHPDNSVSRGFYDLRFVRARPSMGAGFKNWRPARLVDAMRRADGVLIGGRVVLPSIKEISDFSEEQFFGTGARPASDGDWN